LRHSLPKHGKSDCLVTGDKHLLKLTQFERTRIVSPAAFLEVYAGLTT
jgi:predicted nucleic acid-binding protein